jgi:hypothetical protein
MAKELRLKVGDLPFTVAGLADHMPIHYATYLWNELVRQQNETQPGSEGQSRGTSD